eukprot:CAMPEP_0178988970 /NCGR_PEP_ID=MMETSP0795-20121207/4094_1 /TAXON_ID=88552 /ORGANISM="Amoebophrya sp., Strain Ameob2" /LENGTH=577 /DNA_ID=CAMNT_0020680279 /DNA_START=395 /DNA_END=2131 /DNA_ORIENTATION=-
MPSSAAGTSNFAGFGENMTTGKIPEVKVSSGAVFNVGDVVRVNVNRRMVKAKITSVDPPVAEIETTKAGWEEVDEEEKDGLERDGELGAAGSATEGDDGLDLPGGMVVLSGGGNGKGASNGKGSKASGESEDSGDSDPFGNNNSSSSSNANVIKLLPGQHKVLRDVKNKMTKEKFLKFAAPLEVTVGGMSLLAGAREFNSHEEGEVAQRSIRRGGGWGADERRGEREYRCVQVTRVAEEYAQLGDIRPGIGDEKSDEVSLVGAFGCKKKKDEQALLGLMRGINGGGKKAGWSVGSVKSLLQDDDVVAIAKANNKRVPGPKDVDKLFLDCEGAKRDEQRKTWKPVGWEPMEKALKKLLLQHELTDNEYEVKMEWWTNELLPGLVREKKNDANGTASAKRKKNGTKWVWSKVSETFMTKAMLKKEKEDLAAAEQLASAAAEDEHPDAAFERLQLASLRSDVNSGIMGENEVSSKLDYLKSLTAPEEAAPENQEEKKTSSMKRPSSSSSSSSIPMKIVKSSKTSSTPSEEDEDAVAKFERLQKEMEEKWKKQKRGETSSDDSKSKLMKMMILIWVSGGEW